MGNSVQIVPTLNVNSEEDFRQCLQSLELQTTIMQIDIADGIFTNWKNWHDPTIIAKIETPVSYELHLMVENPIEELKKWEHLRNIKRIVAHVESFDENKSMLEIFHELTHFPYDICLALNPDTDRARLEPVLPNLSYVMFLGVQPGKSGQPFQKKILKDILDLNQKHNHIQIEVDGGVHAKNLQEVVAHGADIICMGSAIFSGDKSPAENYKNLIKLL